ncbi:MAG: geranylgeranyl reductase family protein [Bacteroidetes bacterium]|nr:geranylgeranyl reductase family protein [Bacteroidota bacterium]
MSSHDAEVIIVGAGPAGSIAAYELAIQGISVLILEKDTFPRYKVCGGGLTHKILTELPFSVEEVIENRINSVRFSHKFSSQFLRTSANPFIYCTMRDRLDALLLEKAVNAGAKVITGIQVTGIKQYPGSVEVITKSRNYTATLVIGSEGASSTISRAVGLYGDIAKGMAWEAEIEAEKDDIDTYAQTVFLDWGTFPGGYAWVFPKKDHFSIGVGGPASLSKWMMPYYYKFIESTGIRFKETRSIRSWPIPVKVKKGRFHNNLIMVTGDAAGLTDPMTGEGIYYAIRSGKFAASASADFLSGHSSSLQPFTDRVNDELMTELLEANRIQYIFNTIPLKIHQLVRDNDRVWNGFGKVLRGERNYKDVHTALGKWKSLWKLAVSISKLRVKLKAIRYKKRGSQVNHQDPPV